VICLSRRFIASFISTVSNHVLKDVKIDDIQRGRIVGFELSVENILLIEPDHEWLNANTGRSSNSTVPSSASLKPDEKAILKYDN
jgi:hypothetical protein